MRISRILAANQCECKSFLTSFDIRAERPGRRRFPSSAPSAGAANFPRRRPDFPAAVRPAKKPSRNGDGKDGGEGSKSGTPAARRKAGTTRPGDRSSCRLPRSAALPGGCVRRGKDETSGADAKTVRAARRRLERLGETGPSASGCLPAPGRIAGPRPAASRRFSWRRISRRERGRNPRRNRPAPFPPPRSSAEDRRDTPRNRRNSGFPDAKGR